MPKTRFDRYAQPSRPAPDPLKALILERMQALRLHAPEVASAIGVSTNTFFSRMRKPTSDWPLGQLIKAAVFLGIDQEDFRSAIRYSV